MYKEQAKIRKAEAAEKAANAERHKIPPPVEPSGQTAATKDTMPDNPRGAVNSTEEHQLDPLT